jgi:hypothetical protein
MTKPIFAHQFNAATQAQIARQLFTAPKPRTVQLQQAENKPMKNRIRQNSAGLNKTEAAYLQKLKADGWKHIYREPGLPLANGVKYNVDFLVVNEAGRVEGHEVKGRAFSTGIVKLKVAASLFPWIGFKLITKRGSGWAIEEVMP